MLDERGYEVPLPEADIDWRNGLRQLAHAIRETILQHTTRNVNSVITYTIGFAALEVPRRQAGLEADGNGVTSVDVAFDDRAPTLHVPTAVGSPSGSGCRLRRPQIN